MTFSNGGQTPPILIRNDCQPELLTEKNTIIGIIENLEFVEIKLKLTGGDRLFLYTDGIPETTNEERVMVGYDEGLMDVFNKNGKSSINNTLDSIIDEINSFRGKSPVRDDSLLIGFEILDKQI
jgi:sigma-B regulation protein RsbU (phosphoserine phosphatase)